MKLSPANKTLAKNAAGIATGIGASKVITSDLIPIENDLYKQLISAGLGTAAMVLIKSKGKWYLDLAKAAGAGMVIGPVLQLIQKHVLPMLPNSKATQYVNQAFGNDAGCNPKPGIKQEIKTQALGNPSRYHKGFRLGNASHVPASAGPNLTSMY